MTGSLDLLCNIPLLQKQGEGVIYADCGGSQPEITCNCGSCECCDPNMVESCSEPALGNIEDIIEAVFRRREYDIEPEDDDEGKDEATPP